MKQYTGEHKTKVNILGVEFDYVTMKQATSRLLAFLEKNTLEEAQIITTANPEIVMAARKDAEFMDLVNQSDMIVADGIGIIYGSRILKTPLPERVAGYDMIQSIFDGISKKDINVYFLGAGKGIAELAKENMIKAYPGLNIVGVRDGYFDKIEIPSIIEEINAKRTDLLLVGLGAPKQEKFMFSYKRQLKVKVMVGVGGSFDGMSGTIKRAPKFFIKLNLEWFYRLLKQPRRFIRMLQLPLFLLKTIQVRIKGVRHGV